MKCVAAAIVLLASVSSSAAFADPAPASAGLGAALFEDRLAFFESLGPRLENTAPEAAAFRYIEESCAAAGIPTKTTGFGEATNGYSFSRIVEAQIPGARPEELAVVVSVDSWIDAAAPADGSLGLALALTELVRLSRAGASGEPLPVSMRFVFLGAERRGRMAEGEEASLGSRTWISREAGKGPLAVVYLNIDREPGSIRLRSAGAGILSPFWLYDRARRALEYTGLPTALEANRLMLYRLGLMDRYGPLRPYLDAGLPAIELRGEGEGGLPATGEAWFASFMDRFLDECVPGFPAEWDRHYIAFQVASWSAVVRETTYVSFLVLFSALSAASILALTIMRRASTRILLRRTPAVIGQLLALFVALAGIFLAEGGLAQLEAAVLGSGDAWRLAPRIFAAVRIASIFLLFLSVLSILVERKALTPNPYFYEFAALACLGVDIYVFSAISLPLSFYFVWAFLVVGISLWARKPWASIVAYGIMYVPILLLIVELAARPDFSVYVHLIAPGRKGVFALAALSLPFFTFTASPLLFYAPPGALARKRIALLFFTAALALEGGLLAYMASGPAKTGASASLSTVSELIDQDKGSFEASLSADRRLGSGTILRDGLPLSYDSRSGRASLGGADGARRISFTETRDVFLDRVTERIGLGFLKPPYGLSLSLRSGEELHILDCNLPFRVALDGRSATIYAGVNPGRSLELELTVSADFRATIVADASYLDPPAAYAFEDGSSPRSGQFSVLASTLISGGGR